MQYQKMPTIDGIVETGDLRRIKTLKNSKIRFVLQNRKMKNLSIKTDDFSIVPHLEFDLSYNKTLDHEMLFDQLSCLDNLKGLGLIKNAMKVLPENIGRLKALETLELWSNGLKVLPSSFSALNELRYLNLRNNNLTQFPDELSGFEKLKYLNLRFNKIKTLPNSLFQLKNLEELDLSSCGLTSVPPAIGYLEKLCVLHLESNKLETLPSEITKLQNLEVINIKGNDEIDLEQVCKLFAKLPKLKEISFKEWNLTNLPDNFGDMKQLESLNLENNKFTTLPESLKNLKNLKEIHLEGNPELDIESFIDILASWPRMTEFDLNVISVFKKEDDPKSLPENIDKLKNIESFLLSFAPGLIAIPETIGNLNQLKHLRITNTGIISLPQSIGNLKNLSSLAINGNQKLSEIPDTIYQLTGLKELYFSGNNVKLNYCKLTEFKNLEKLSVNNIDSQDFINLGQLNNLKELHWRDEELTHLPDEFFELQNIQKIRFSSFTNIELDQEIDKLTKIPSIRGCLNFI